VINPQTRIVQVDLDPLEIGRNYPVAVGVIGDAKAVGATTAPGPCVISSPKDRPNPTWREKRGAGRTRRQARLRAEIELTGERLMPQRVYPELLQSAAAYCMGDDRPPEWHPVWATIDCGSRCRASHVQRLCWARRPGHGGYCVGLRHQARTS